MSFPDILVKYNYNTNPNDPRQRAISILKIRRIAGCCGNTVPCSNTNPKTDGHGDKRCDSDGKLLLLPRGPPLSSSRQFVIDTCDGDSIVLIIAGDYNLDRRGDVLVVVGKVFLPLSSFMMMF